MFTKPADPLKDLKDYSNLTKPLKIGELRNRIEFKVSENADESAKNFA